MKSYNIEKTHSLPLKSEEFSSKYSTDHYLLNTLHSNDKFFDINNSLAKIASHRSSNARNKSDTTNATAERLMNFQSFVETNQKKKNIVVSHKYTLSTCSGMGFGKIKEEINNNNNNSSNNGEKMEFAKYFSRNANEKEIVDNRYEKYIFNFCNV